MTHCWSEGDLRAYIDRELQPEAMEQAARHLADCPECSQRCAALSARAETIAQWMDALNEPAPSAGSSRRGRMIGKWGAAAAACVAAAILLAPRKSSPPARPAMPAPAPVASAAQPVRVQPVPAAAHPRRKPKRNPHRAEQTETFVALDDEPFETGWVVRMALGPDQIQADVVFSADGRARAYRLVGDSPN
jgi:anti-sigma factor RsiW